MIFYDRVKETTTTTGVGAYTLAGAKSGFQAFSAVVADSEQVYYAAFLDPDWEVGYGTFTLAGTTLSRDAILASSNAGSAVNWSAGDKDIWINVPASWFNGLLGSIDHGSINGLTDDDHPGYAWLAGRAGGQVWYAGTATTEGLDIYANNVDVSTGHIRLFGKNNADYLMADFNNSGNTIYGTTTFQQQLGTANAETLQVRGYGATVIVRSVSTGQDAFFKVWGAVNSYFCFGIDESVAGDPFVFSAYAGGLGTNNVYSISYSTQIFDFVNTPTVGGTDVALITDVVTDHGALGGLTDDDHSGYAWLAGRSSKLVWTTTSLSGQWTEIHLAGTGTGSGIECYLDSGSASPLFTWGTSDLNMYARIVSTMAISGSAQTGLDFRNTGDSGSSARYWTQHATLGDAFSRWVVGTPEASAARGAMGVLRSTSKITLVWGGTDTPSSLATGSKIFDVGSTLIVDFVKPVGVPGVTFAAQSANPGGSDTLWQDDGTNYVANTLVWARDSVFLGEVSIGAPGNEQGSVTINGVTYDAIAKINDFGGTRDAGLIIHRHVASATIGATLLLTKSNTNDSTHAILNDDDLIGSIAFGAHDGTDYSLAALIEAYVDGTPGANDMPTRLEFKVSADGTQVPATALTILNDGTVNAATALTQGGTAVSLAGHTHDDRYYTETEIDAKLNTAVTSANSTASYTFNLSTAKSFDITLTANCTFSVSNPLATGNHTEFFVRLRQDTTAGRTVTWFSGLDWGSAYPDSEPTLSIYYNQVDVFRFTSKDGGTTWLGEVVGQAYEGPPKFRYWRIAISKAAQAGTPTTGYQTRVSELRLFDRFGNEWPAAAQTSFTNPLNVTECGHNSTFAGWYAFDKVQSDSNRWISDNSVETHTLIIDMGSGADIDVVYYKLAPDGAASIGYYPVDWTLEGSNTGSFAGEETIIDQQTGITSGWANNSLRQFNCDYTVSF